MVQKAKNIWILVLRVDPDSGSAYEKRQFSLFLYKNAYMYDPTLLSQAAEKQTENWPASLRVLGGTGLPVQEYF
jgi:hypothetical protein